MSIRQNQLSVPGKHKDRTKDAHLSREKAKNKDIGEYYFVLPKGEFELDVT